MREKRARTSSPSPTPSFGEDANLVREPAPGFFGGTESHGTMKKAPAGPEKRARTSSSSPAPSSAAYANLGREPAPRYVGGTESNVPMKKAPAGPEKNAPAPSPARGSMLSNNGGGTTIQTTGPAWRLATEEASVVGTVPAPVLGAMKFLPETNAYKRISALMRNDNMCKTCRELYAYQVAQFPEVSTAPILMFETGHFKIVEERYNTTYNTIYRILFRGCDRAECLGPNAAPPKPALPCPFQPSPHQGGGVQEPN